MHVHYIRDDYHGTYRIWQSDSFGDHFDMVPIADFEPHVLAFVQRMPSLFVANFPEDDSGELVCNLCKLEREKTAADAPKPRGRPRNYPAFGSTS